MLRKKSRKQKANFVKWTQKRRKDQKLSFLFCHQNLSVFEVKHRVFNFSDSYDELQFAFVSTLNRKLIFHRY